MGKRDYKDEDGKWHQIEEEYDTDGSGYKIDYHPDGEHFDTEVFLKPFDLNKGNA